MAKKTLGYQELHWRCPNCNSRNVGTAQTCVSCGAAQPENVAFEQAAGSQLIEDAARVESARQAPDIHCPYCGTRNPAGTEACHHCGGNLTDGQRRVSGRILGAYNPNQPALKDIPCPACGQPNHPQAAFCVYCGSPLHQSETPLPASQAAAVTTPATQPAAVPKKLPMAVIIILVLVSLGCVTALLIAILSGGNDQPLQGTVTNLMWQRSIEILELQPVSRTDWQFNIPDDGRIQGCEERFYRSQDQPAPGAIEVCGTPYSVDLGNGYAEVVQDCVYEIYENYCRYETEEWVQTEILNAYGSGHDAYWPATNLTTEQLTGIQEEQYTITFSADGQEVKYQTEDYTFYQQVDVGSEWWIETGLFGSVKNISPAD
ncbi:MAG: zinc ribbon domain-containing protein [Anaerolineae bacterium]|nr:zinc ribbon domain-containing protein [Anaerolineae bacterium]